MLNSENIDEAIYKNYNLSYEEVMWSTWLHGENNSLVSDYLYKEHTRMTGASCFDAWIDCNWSSLPANWIIAWDNFLYDPDDMNYDIPPQILS